MDFKELTDLINIRDYVANSMNLPSIDRATVNDLSGIYLLLDKKIISILLGPEFKEYVSFKDAQQAKQQVANMNNIRSGIKK